MDKYEYRLKAEHIVKLVGRKKYTEAMEVADEIDWNRVKNVQMLCTVSDVYAKNDRFEDAREILFLANDRSPADRMIVYQIVELSIALGDLKEAVNYFREYSQLAPNDTNIYILKYKLYVANNASIETLISVLEEFKEQDFHEEWGLELARLYAEAGYTDRCVDLCDELDLWFNEGPYVLQALELKQKFELLTESQQEKLDQSYAMRDQAADVERMMVQEQAKEEVPLEQEEDMFYAGVRYEEEKPEQKIEEKNQDDMNVGFEEHIERPDELDESLANLEYYPDDDTQFSDEEEIEDEAAEYEEEQSEHIDEELEDQRPHKEKKHSGGMFSRFGRLSRMLVEPMSDYDMEEEDKQEISDEEEVVEENQGAVQQQHKEFQKNTEFNLGDLAAAQAEYEENNEAVNFEDESEQNIESQESELGDTKQFDKETFREKIDRSVYEKNIQNALRNLGLSSNSDVTSEDSDNENNVAEEVTDNNLSEEMKEELDQTNDLAQEKQAGDNDSAGGSTVWNGMSQYDTMNLQKELAKSIQKLLEATEMDDVDSTLEDVKKLVEDSNIPELTETMRFRTVRASMLSNWARNQAEKLCNAPQIEESVERNCRIFKAEGNQEPARKFASVSRRSEVEVIPSIKLKPTKEDRKRKLEQILVQEDDGQIGLIMPEQETVEKQITGQLNIEDILKEWERQKNNEETEREKKQLEEARKKALNETQEFMSQVMDLLNQCLPKCSDDSRSFALSEQLKKVQQALNSTSDLSQISKLNSELADTLDKICPTKEQTVSEEEDYGIFQEEVAVSEEKNAPEETINPEEIIEDPLSVPDVEETAEEYNTDDLSHIMEEALQNVAMQVQEAVAVEGEDSLEKIEEDFIQEESVQEDDDAADDLEEKIEADLPESAEAIVESDENVDLFEPDEENTFVEEVSEEAEETEEPPVQFDESPLKKETAEDELTDTQKEVFAYFNSVESVRKQIHQLLNVDKKGNENIIITGADGCGKTSLAIRIVKAQYMNDESKQNKVAKIKGSTLNSYDLDQVFETVNGGVLIIEKAVALSENTMNGLNKKLNEGADVQLIITTKNKSVERLRARNPEFMSRFTVSLEVPNYSNNELVEYGKVYAKANDYSIEDMAVLALFSCLGNLQSVRGTLDFNDVKDIIDSAIENSTKRSGKLFKRMFGKRNEQSGQILLEEDFEKINIL